MAVWPLTLPQSPSGFGYQERAPHHGMTATPDVGPVKRRPRFTAGIRTMTCSIQLTAAEVAVLDAFYQTTLEGGTQSFDWVHPRTGAAVVFRYLEPPDYQAQGPLLYRATMKMEILP